MFFVEEGNWKGSNILAIVFKACDGDWISLNCMGLGVYELRSNALPYHARGPEFSPLPHKHRLFKEEDLLLPEAKVWEKS